MPDPVATTPAPAAPVKKGKEILKEVRGVHKVAKAETDYTEDFNNDNPKGVIATTPAAIVPPVVTTPTIDPKDQALKEAQTRAQILEIENARAKAERDLLMAQEQARLSAPTPSTPEPEIDLVAMLTEDPLQAMTIIAQRAAKEEREKVLQEMEVKQQSTDFQEQVQAKKNTYQANIQKVVSENPELADPNHRLTKIVQEIEAANPWLFTIPDGPLRTMEIARTKYELETLKASGAPASGAIVQAEKKGQEAEAARQESVRAASMVSGPERGTPPSASVKLTPEQEFAARKLRMTPEKYIAYLGNSRSFFKKEESPRRSKS